MNDPYAYLSLTPKSVIANKVDMHEEKTPKIVIINKVDIQAL